MAPTSRVGDPGDRRAAASTLAPSTGGVRVLTGPDGAPPAVDVGIGPALLRQVAAQGTGGWLRLYRPAPATAFSRRDTLSPGFGAATEVSAAHGFAPVVRAPGGRAAVYHEGALCLDLVVAEDEPRGGVTRRFVELAEVLVEALATVGVAAAVGPVADEYCPGRFSVNAGGRVKLAGTAQRVVRGGWFLGAVLLVTDAEPVRRVVEATYRALGLTVDARTAGAVTDVAPGVRVEEVRSAVLAALGRRLDLHPAAVPGDLLDRAREAAPDLPRPAVRTGAALPVQQGVS
ncbi:lipoate--protein ligase family protein [Geodermatophilus sp. DSM 45219]|uniref:lipoate--protein ligase family protein n=1 Tax=Geodermatophilus sp. DSM 45219 TaxID=1881103 RepID=UPI0008812AA2|nr:lipoate--protein ligase family protein [Geodermatophilus sp. DSM 45219]SDN94338.1 Lipoate-protein ligase A [Geodermatophilus sp. DSM 45219]